MVERNMGLKMHKMQNEQTDIISIMPDAILSHILSFVPTEDVVRTTVLSSRWKNLWTSVHNLHFDILSHKFGQSKKHRVERNKCFVNFVEGVLGLHQSKIIRTFYLRSSGVQSNSRIGSWISFAVNRDVCNLDLDVYIGSGSIPELPRSVLTCKTLVELRLHKDFVLDIPDSVACFPSLRILTFRVERESPDAKSINKLFRSCPVLEELSFYLHGRWRQHDNDMLNFDICIPTLKRLSINSNHKFVVRTCNLEYFNSTSSMCYLMNEMPLVSEAVVKAGRKSMSRDEANCAMKLLRGITNTKFLSLSSITIAALHKAFNGDFPTFPNLKHLDIESDSGWKLLPHFLCNSPNMEALTLKKDDLCIIDGVPVPQDFDAQKLGTVPNCLLLRLKYIKIQCGIWEDESDDILEIAKYLLKNSQVLEKFVLNCYYNRVWKQILKLPRGSKACKVDFGLVII